jgi:protein O-mannosyl-transferase
MSQPKKIKNKSKRVAAGNRERQPTKSSASSRVIPAGTTRILGVILFALAIMLYAQSFNHDFAYDDIAAVQGNRFVHKGFSGIRDILTTQYFEGYYPTTTARGYRPVSLITYAIEYQFFGLNPRIYHADNILIYALTSVILLLQLLRLLRSYHWSLAFVVSLLFVFHPVHAEVVANIKSRDELIGFFNFCVALLFLLKNLDNSKPWKTGLSYAFFFLALASKETLITTTACIPLVLYFFMGLRTNRIVRLTIPYVVILVIFLIVRAAVLPSLGDNVAPVSYFDNPILAARNSSERVGTTIYTLGMYLKTLLFPYKLAADYSYNSIPIVPIGNAFVLTSLLLYILLAIVAIKGFARKSIFSFSILWFFVTISIVSSVFVTSSSAYADRFLFTPSLSVCLALAFALYKLGGLYLVKSPQFPKIDARLLLAGTLLLIVIAICCLRVFSYVPVWKNNQTLFAYNVKVNPQSAKTHFNYGGEMVNKGVGIRDSALLKQQPMDTATIASLARRGLQEIQKGEAIFPDNLMANVHEGDAWVLLGDFNEAEKSFRKALSISKDDRVAINSLGGLLFNTGRYLEAAQTWEKVPSEMRTAGDYYNLYIAYQALGDVQKANLYKQLSGR